MDKFLKSRCTNMNNHKDGKKETIVYAYGGADTYAYTLTARNGLTEAETKDKSEFVTI
jgi:hypothetical protein